MTTHLLDALFLAKDYDSFEDNALRIQREVEGGLFRLSRRRLALRGADGRDHHKGLKALIGWIQRHYKSTSVYLHFQGLLDGFFTDHRWRGQGKAFESWNF
ncbi:MAG: hypothetical protein ACYS22_22150 [Planctomycetota bacterium]